MVGILYPVEGQCDSHLCDERRRLFFCPFVVQASVPHGPSVKNSPLNDQQCCRSMRSGSSDTSAAASKAVPHDINEAAPIAAEGFGVMLGAAVVAGAAAAAVTV
jgi:hypothetical protein